MGTQHFLRLMNKIHGATVTAVSDINELMPRKLLRRIRPSVSSRTRSL